ncbi:MAG: hypothetical protein QOJ37_2973, partial [Pseudonocardiales bacterium]|nr:hypothetical protein [Pseudonocardiales bacterium]
MAADSSAAIVRAHRLWPVRVASGSRETRLDRLVEVDGELAESRGADYYAGRMPTVSILDDYQRVALASADWSAVSDRYTL